MSAVALSQNTFPAESISKVLAAWWNSKTQSPLKSPPRTGVKGTVFALQPELSSQQAVGVLVSCKGVLGYRPSKDTIKKGGYADKAEFIKTLLQAIEKEFVSKQPVTQTLQKQKGASPNATVAY